MVRVMSRKMMIRSVGMRGKAKAKSAISSVTLEKKIMSTRGEIHMISLET
jgi:hypothetical protein